MRYVARALATILALPAVAWATPTAKLHYVRGEGAGACVDEEGLKLAVARRLGYDPFRVIAERTVSVEVRKQSSRFVARLVLVDQQGKEQGQRELASRSDDCADLTDTLALTVSIALDPLSLTRPATPEPALSGAAAPEPSEKPEALPPEPAASERATPELALPPAPSAPPAAPLTFVLGIGMHAAFATGPAHVGFGPDLFLGVRKSWVGLELTGRIDAPASADVAPRGSLSTSLTGASLAACAHFGWFALCLPATLGSLASSSRDIAQPRSEAGLWFAVGVRASATIPIVHGLGVRSFVEVAAPFTPYELALDGRAVYTSSPITGLVGVGPSLAFE